MDKKIIYIFFSIFLISLNFFLVEEYKNHNPDRVFYPDDLHHISIADSFRDDNTFNLQYLVIGNSTDTFKESFFRYPEIPDNSKGPIYYILLGTFYKINSTSHEELYDHASLFNNILSSIFLVLFFFFVNKISNLKIACGSSILISAIPGFILNSHIVNIDPVVSIFIISSLFFIERKKICYILFGVFSGLSTLTHPIANPLIASYSIFLLIKREFRGFFIVISIWLITLSPWMIRNYSIFSNIGPGLQIPFSSKISEIIRMIIPRDNSYTGVDQANKLLDSQLGIFDLIYNSIQNSGYLFNMQLLLVFVLIFSGLTFLHIENKKRRWKYILASFTIFFISFILVESFIIKSKISNWSAYYQPEKLTESNSIIPHNLELIIIFVIIPAAIFLIFKKKRSLFDKKINQTHLFILFYALIHLFAMYIFVNNSLISITEEISSRFLLLQTILLVPLALIGLEKIFKLSFPKIQLKQNIIMGVIIFLIFSPMIINMVEANEFQKTHKNNMGSYDNKIINDQILKNTNSNEIIGSQNPGETWYRTDRFAVSIPVTINQEQFDEYIEFFRISHLIFYDEKANVDEIIEFPTKKYFYEMQKIGDGYVLKVKNISGANIDTPYPFIAKMLKLENEGNFAGAKKILNEIRNFNSDIKLEEEICSGLTDYKIYDVAEFVCNRILEKDHSNLIAMTNLVILYSDTNQNEKKEQILRIIDAVSYEEIDDNHLVILNLIKKSCLAKIMYNEKCLFTLAEIFFKIKYYDEALKIYYQLMELDRLNPIIYIKIAEYYEVKNKTQLAIHNFETSLRLDPNNENVLEKINMLKNQE